MRSDWGFIVNILQSLGFACWIPLGHLVHRHAMREPVSKIDIVGCVL